MTPKTMDLSQIGALLHEAFACGTKLVDYAFINTNNVFECAQKILSVSSAAQLDAVMTDNVRDQFEALSEQVAELSLLMSPDPDNTRLSFWD